MMPRSMTSEAPVAAARPGSNLVIDDEEIMREILETLLMREGYDVRLAANAAEGLELARSVPFDAAIVDMMMPGIDGISALDELKKIDDDMPVLSRSASLTSVSAATRERGSWARIASSTASEIWSATLSGWPSDTDSEVKRKLDMLQGLRVRGKGADSSKARTPFPPNRCPSAAHRRDAPVPLRRGGTHRTIRAWTRSAPP